MTQTFVNRTSTLASMISLIVFGIVGLILCIGSVLLGIIFILLGVLVFYLIRRFGNDTIVQCDNDGFTVKTVNKWKGTSANRYQWSEVTKTLYFERTINSGDDSATKQYFQVETQQGIAFRIQKTKQFGDLIDVVNNATAHLPYVWEIKHGPLNKLTKTFERISRA